MNRFACSALIFGLVAAAPLQAQGRGRNLEGVPPGHRPPPGMCRIWIDGVPPGQQPAPTDCANAVRNRPSNGRIIFGDDANRFSKGKWKPKFEGDRRGDLNDDRDDRSRVVRRRDLCVDRNRDGRCDDATMVGTYPSRLPDMMAGVLLNRGKRTNDVGDWFGNSVVSARPGGMVRNGHPQRIMWYDQGGRVVQVWTDTNFDGRADQVEIVRAGRVVQVVR